MYLYNAPRARSGTGNALRSEEMDAIETETQTEPGMRGIKTDMRGVGAETETTHELSARCVDRGSGSGMSAPSLLHRALPPSAPGCLLLSHPPARHTLPTSRLLRMLAFLMARQEAARGRGRGSGRSRGAGRGGERERERGRGAGRGRGRGKGSGIGRAGEGGAATQVGIGGATRDEETEEEMLTEKHFESRRLISISRADRP